MKLNKKYSLSNFSLDLNYSIKHNLLKLSFTYDIEDPFFSMTFISPKLQMSQINISYGYILISRKLLPSRSAFPNDISSVIRRALRKNSAVPGKKPLDRGP